MGSYIIINPLNTTMMIVKIEEGEEEEDCGTLEEEE